MGNLGNRRDVADADRQVPRRLDVNQFRIRTDRRADRFRVRCVDERRFDAVFVFQMLRQQAINRNLGYLRGNQMIAGF